MLPIALQDVILHMPIPLGMVLRSVNIFLAVWTAVFAFAAVPRTDLPYQRARFTGLALFSLTFAWGTLFRIDSPVTVQVPFFTIALGVCVYGTLGFLRRAPK